MPDDRHFVEAFNWFSLSYSCGSWPYCWFGCFPNFSFQFFSTDLELKLRFPFRPTWCRKMPTFGLCFTFDKPGFREMSMFGFVLFSLSTDLGVGKCQCLVFFFLFNWPWYWCREMAMFGLSFGTNSWSDWSRIFLAWPVSEFILNLEICSSAFSVFHFCYLVILWFARKDHWDQILWQTKGL